MGSNWGANSSVGLDKSLDFNNLEFESRVMGPKPKFFAALERELVRAAPLPLWL